MRQVLRVFGRLHESASVLGTLTRRSPGHAMAWYNLAAVLLDVAHSGEDSAQGQLEVALGAFMALADPALGPALLREGGALEGALPGLVPAAVAAVVAAGSPTVAPRALAAPGSQVENARTMLADALRDRGALAAALAVSEAALAAEGRAAEASWEGAGSPSAAVAAAVAAAAAARGSASGHLQRGVTLHRGGDLDRAGEAYESAKAAAAAAAAALGCGGRGAGGAGTGPHVASSGEPPSGTFGRFLWASQDESCAALERQVTVPYCFSSSERVGS